MIECHPLLKPIVSLAKPVVHAVRHYRHIGVRHRIHHLIHRVATPSPGTTVMTVCQKIAGPLLAGGVALLPPASGIPPAGGVGGFPAGAPGDFVGPGPAFGGPGIIGPGYFPGNFAGPGVASGAPVLFAGAEVPTTPVVTTPGVSPGVSTPITVTTTTPPAMTTPPTNTPTTTTPPDTTPPNTTSPPTGTQPGGSTPVPEPASLALLGAGLAAVIVARRRARRAPQQ